MSFMTLKSLECLPLWDSPFHCFFFYAFSFFNTLSVVSIPQGPFLATFPTVQALQMISFNTMSLTSTQIPVFPKFIFPAGTSLLKLQLHISYHLCDISLNNITKNNANSICFKLNLFQFLPYKNTWIFSCISSLS